MSNVPDRRGNPHRCGNLLTRIILIWLLCFLPFFDILFDVVNLLGRKLKSSRRSRHPCDTRQEGHTPGGTRTTGSVERSAGKRDVQRDDPQERLSQLAHLSKRLLLLGGVVSVLLAIALVWSLNGAVDWLIEGETQRLLEELVDRLPLLFWLCAGLGCLWFGFRMKNQVSRYRNYLEVIGKRTAVSVSTLASASGLPTEKVRDDLTEMLNQGILPAGCLDDRIGRT